MFPKYLTVHDVAALLSDSERHVRNLLRHDDDPLPAVLIGGKYRISEIALGEWLARQPAR